jgi:hypothetical protein
MTVISRWAGSRAAYFLAASRGAILNRTGLWRAQSVCKKGLQKDKRRNRQHCEFENLPHLTNASILSPEFCVRDPYHLILE